MTDYENGIDTRKKILSAAQMLFYEKGYAETSFQDIYRQAHVSRGTVYYHYKSKADMRYEVLWEFTIAPKRIVEKYCDQSRYHYLLALCITWIQITKDPKYRKFIRDYCSDCLVYSSQMDMSLYHATIYQVTWGQFWARDRISDASFAPVYGYLSGSSRKNMFRWICSSSATAPAWLSGKCRKIKSRLSGSHFDTTCL